MLATPASPLLTLTQGLSPKARMEDSILHSGVEVGKFEAENQFKLEELRQRREELMLAAILTGFGFSIAMGFATFVFASAVAGVVAAMPPATRLFGELQGVSQRYLLMSELVDALEDEDVAIEVELRTEGVRNIDLFLRFPEIKEYVLIQIRSMGNAKITFDEQRDALRFRRQKGGNKTWEPNPLQELAEQERWIRRHRSDLLGTASRDKRRPFAKLLVIWDDTATFLGDHPEHLYVTMDDQKFLTIRSNGTISIVMRSQVIDFIRAYLSSRRSRKTSENS